MYIYTDGPLKDPLHSVRYISARHIALRDNCYGLRISDRCTYIYTVYCLSYFTCGMYKVMYGYIGIWEDKWQQATVKSVIRAVSLYILMWIIYLFIINIYNNDQGRLEILNIQQNNIMLIVITLIFSHYNDHQRG